MTKSLKTQSSIVKYVKGSIVNSTASASEASTAIRYATGSSSVYLYGTPDFSVIHNAVYGKVHPGAVGVVWSTGLGHMLVISGTNDSGQKIYLINPAVNASSAWYSYAQLKSGTTINGQVGTVNCIWLIQ